MKTKKSIVLKSNLEHDKKNERGYYLSAVEWLDVYAKRWIGTGLSQEQYDKLRYKYRIGSKND